MSLADELFCTINVEYRTIDIPPELEIVGVESDEDVTIRKFVMPWLYDDSDLSEFSCRVNFENAGGQKGVYFVQDVAKNGDTISFSWTLSRLAMAHAGDLKFVICMIRNDAVGDVLQEWNSTQGKFSVLKGLRVDVPTEEVEVTRDVAAELVALIQAAAEKAIKDIENAKNS